MTSSIEAGDAVGKPREILIQGIAHLIALCSFSVAQPVYDVLADSPELFTSYRVDGLDLIAFILTISLVIPAVLATLFVLTLKVSKNCGKYYFRISAGLLLVLFVSLALRDTEISVAIRLGIGVLIALGALMLLEKSDPLKIWLSWLAVGALIFPISFLFNPNISTLFSTQSASISSDIESAKHPVFLIVFDKLPTSILINKNHEIDSDRYPNFSAFANDAYWFRNNTASAQDTISSVPNILTGNYPEGKKTPNLATYPRNLFVHMQNNFNMNVMEYVTSLNPAETDLYAGDRTTKYRLMMADIFLIYLHMTLPDQLRQRLPSLEERTFNFWSLAKIPPNGLWRMVRFIKRIGDEKNWFHYLHIDLPHGPFKFIHGDPQFRVCQRNGVTGVQIRYPSTRQSSGLFNRYYSPTTCWAI